MQNRGDVLYTTGMRRLYDSRTFSVSTNADCDVGFSRLAASGIFAMGADYSLSGEPCLLPDCESDYDSVSEAVTSGTILERKNPTQADYEEFFDELFETGVRTLVHISAGSEIADDYAVAVKASKNEMVKFPRCQLYVVDSHAFSAGLPSNAASTLPGTRPGSAAAPSAASFSQRVAASALSGLTRRLVLPPSAA